MSLYFEERSEEQKEDPANDKIVFTHPWIIELPQVTEDEDEEIKFRGVFVTCYNFASIGWYLYLIDDVIYISKVSSGGDAFTLAGKGTCFISCTLYYDNDMRHEYYSSPRVSALSNSSGDFFCTEDGFLTKFVDAFKEGKVTKIVIFVEMHLPAKYFCRPFEHPSHVLQSKSCDKFPDDMDNDFRFEFLKDSDYSIKCSDGSIPALRMVLNVSSKLMKKHFKESKDVEMVVEHSLDVVKPIILYLHSLCFKMPTSFELDFADRLLKAINFFQLERVSDICGLIELSLCEKFAKEKVDFDSILQWLSLTFRHGTSCLGNMIATVIVNKFYYKWYRIFPENARNSDNPYFRDIFGPRGDTAGIFEIIDTIFWHSLFTNVILN